MKNDLRELILQWTNLPDNELDAAIINFITCSKLDFITAYNDIYHSTNIIDERVLNRLFDAFIRLAAKYIDEETKCTIRKWEQMSDEDIEQEFLEMYRVSGYADLGKIFKFIDTKDMRVRAEKILLELSPKFRQIDILHMLKNWSELTDYELSAEILRELVSSGMASSTSHFAFVRELYVNITDEALRKRVDDILLAMANPEYLASSPAGGSERALYACLKLNIPGGRECLVRMVQYIKNPFNPAYSSMVSMINCDLLREYPVPEAENFLVTLVESAPPDIAELLKDPRLLPQSEYYHLQSLFTALQRLKVINAELAARYADKLKLPIWELPKRP